ncbi:Pectin lyase-like protein [Glarea lozoyensis ATCC 20868]|uniref:pectinesterase n=1 Tax=Glarea lozoyensis (strain ATCC 20868 / MF5171) TaxID=1116229 RepID=S3D0X4_GLAL2|nr:Pectin lyase-like protein [Glarea lozoyensis ATCC 20868]EPE30784.1 Pectin lyase-like protein [Glarea lozoyensis ATCC 20868]
MKLLNWPALLLALTKFATLATAHPSGLTKCQLPTRNPLSSCPKNTILVSSSDKRAHFTTIQSAILSLPDDHSSQTILILPGNYTEQLNVTRRGPLTLIGQTSKPTSQSSNTVTVLFSAANVQASYTDNAFTSVLTVSPTLEASLTGSGPTGYAVPNNTVYGNTDFRVYNINFRNVFSEASVGPSLAVSVSRANAGFYYSGFYSYQDTVYIGKLGNAYFKSSEIAGQTDFLYGFGTAFIQSSRLLLRNCGGGITAWKGANTTFPNKYGVYISQSTVVAANSTIAPTIIGKCFLGRPWNIQHRSVFMDTYLDATINAAGYKKWGTGDERFSNLTLMAEYKDFGPGFNETGRIVGGVTTLLSEKQVKAYDKPVDVFMDENGRQPYVGWIDEDA